MGKRNDFEQLHYTIVNGAGISVVLPADKVLLMDKKYVMFIGTLANLTVNIGVGASAIDLTKFVGAANQPSYVHTIGSTHIIEIPMPCGHIELKVMNASGSDEQLAYFAGSA